MTRIACFLITLAGFAGSISGFELVPFRDGELWGYADPYGTIVYPPQFISAGVFRDNYARVQTEHGYSFITMKGQPLFVTELVEARDFSDGMAAVKTKAANKWGFIDQTLSAAIPATYQEVGDFSENVAPVKFDGKWGVIDKQGKVLVPFKYDEIKPCRENAMAACADGKWGFIRPSGEPLIDFQYQRVHPFSEGLASVSRDGQSYIYIDAQGKQAVPGEYQWAGSFHDGIATVKKSGAYGAIDKTGKELIPPTYGYLSDFSDGLAVCAVNFHYGYINARGELVIPLCYTEALPFENGIARVWDRKKVLSFRDQNSTSKHVIPEGGGYIDLKNKQFYKN